MDTSLNNRTAIITGGSLGLGLAMAKHFYSAGAKVAILARRPEPLEQAAHDIAQQPGNGEVACFACDVTDPKAVVATHKAVVEHFGAVDILVNNAGQSAAKPFTQISDEEWQADLDLKLMAAVRLTRLVWPAMQAQKWGRVINLLNVYAKTPDANTAPTSISRAAGMALTKVLSAEGAADNILVNALLIGFLESDQIRRRHVASGSNDSLEEFIAKAGERLPMGRMGRAEECADLALFLASERGSYITGCAINMDGGLSKVV
ncbi:MAG: SDR family oxidoreductase [Pseudomonadota bacterium]|nr:SDR family oxidoreductase [Pseudomonadota bacterium]